ncbi:hypothetical protein [Streptomyces palmae]|uniref:DsrE family protein n=1 Tax=Streptomyces palmae TaxID=1701085 RepID=A0A4Z0HE07_9ACTN|nr:hypothetical protein [Streptomyces palmae]TGB19336.1 hypothetical protein E4099_00430 [Streptomyces palmae]
MTYLAVIDRGYRGTLEAQFFDALYGVLAFRGQLGTIDLVLRGTAVTAAVTAESAPPRLKLAGLPEITAPDPRASVATLVEEGVAVYVDRHGLTALGLDEDRLLPGVRCVDSTRLALSWDTYQHVWFL